MDPGRRNRKGLEPRGGNPWTVCSNSEGWSGRGRETGEKKLLSRGPLSTTDCGTMGCGRGG